MSDANHVLNGLELEMLHALYRLRYLTTEQLSSVWYGDRTPGAARKRLSRLQHTGAVHQTQTLHGVYPLAWSLGPKGLRTLRAMRAERYVHQRPSSIRYIPHQIETNQVFLTLSAGEPVWDRLPFAWQASRGVAFNYQERRRDEFGVLRKRQARLIPDALVTPKKSTAPRVFIELDRSTECLREDDGRTSIRRKLRAYRTFMVTGDWYDQAFRDDRPVRVVFVLSRRDNQAANPALRDRRKRSIAAAAREL